MGVSSVEMLSDEMSIFHGDVQIFPRSNDVNVPGWRRSDYVTSIG